MLILESFILSSILHPLLFLISLILFLNSPLKICEAIFFLNGISAVSFIFIISSIEFSEICNSVSSYIELKYFFIFSLLLTLTNPCTVIDGKRSSSTGLSSLRYSFHNICRIALCFSALIFSEILLHE